MKLDFITIQTKDLKASIDFYSDVLGFEIERQFSPGPGMEIVFLNDMSGNKVEFIYNEKAKPYSGQGISLGFYVEDIDVIEKHLKDKGVEITYGPATMKSGVKLMQAKDNNGLELGFVQEFQ